jgi:AcrR family transcriptional regulator
MEKAMDSRSKDEKARAEIIKAAEDLFQKWGLNKTTMGDIAKRAGKGKSTLYYYFKSKEEIFDTVVLAELDYVFSKAKEATLEANTAKEKMRRFLLSSLTELRNYACAFRIARTEIRRNFSFFERMRKRFEPREVSFIKEIITLGLKENRYSFAHDREIETAAKIVAGIIHAMELYLLLENDDSAQIDLATKFISDGL